MSIQGNSLARSNLHADVCMEGVDENLEDVGIFMDDVDVFMEDMDVFLEDLDTFVVNNKFSLASPSFRESWSISLNLINKWNKFS